MHCQLYWFIDPWLPWWFFTVLTHFRWKHFVWALVFFDRTNGYILTVRLSLHTRLVPVHWNESCLGVCSQSLFPYCGRQERSIAWLSITCHRPHSLEKIINTRRVILSFSPSCALVNMWLFCIVRVLSVVYLEIWLSVNFNCIWQRFVYEQCTRCWMQDHWTTVQRTLTMKRGLLWLPAILKRFKVLFHEKRTSANCLSVGV